MSPERPLAEFEADQVRAPGEEGEMGIFPGHMAMVSALKPGVLSVWESGSRTPVHYYVGGGYLQIIEDRATVLAEVIDTAGELDRARAEAAAQRALQRLARTTDAATDIGRALNALGRAKARKRLLDLNHQ